MEAILEILGIIVVLVGVCVLAFYATKLIAKSYRYKGAGDNIKLCDRVMLSYDKSLLVVTVADKALLLSVNKDSIRLICELDKDSLNAPMEPEGVDFSTVLKNTALSKYFGNKKERGDEDI